MLKTRANGDTPIEDDLKAWIIPQIPGKSFEVDVATAEEGWALVNRLADFQLFMFEQNVMPDYSNVVGVVRYEKDGEGGFDWYDVDEYGIPIGEEDNEN